jgi:hypothetical protein
MPMLHFLAIKISADHVTRVILMGLLCSLDSAVVVPGLPAFTGSGACGADFLSTWPVATAIVGV